MGWINSDGAINEDAKTRYNEISGLSESINECFSKSKKKKTSKGKKNKSVERRMGRQKKGRGHKKRGKNARSRKQQRRRRKQKKKVFTFLTLTGALEEGMLSVRASGTFTNHEI